MGFLYDYQMDAVNKMKNGCILNGGVGSGKSRTGLYYYFKEQGGSFVDHNYVKMKNPKDLYIITTAMKRDKHEWESEIANYRMSTDGKNTPYKHKVVIDSWNNIKKYKNVAGAFFIFDEDCLTGKGVWVKTFYNIARKNKWIILSATPGDTWEQYFPVFKANGFFKTKADFIHQHVVYSPYCKFPKIDRYINTKQLQRYRDSLLIDMDFARKTRRHDEDVYVSYDHVAYKDVYKRRWDPFNDKPIEQASQLCYILRKIVNQDVSRQIALLELLEDHPKAIIFYSYDYELDILHEILDASDFTVAEWNGHNHQPLPTSKKWAYLVQYAAGAEGWNAITTDTVIFFSQQYSYKTLEQAKGRIDRVNTKFIDLYYYHIKSRSGIDLAISRALSEKRRFNESRWVGKNL